MDALLCHKVQLLTHKRHAQTGRTPSTVPSASMPTRSASGCTWTQPAASKTSCLYPQGIPSCGLSHIDGIQRSVDLRPTAGRATTRKVRRGST